MPQPTERKINMALLTPKAVTSSDTDDDVLTVTSKVKAYIRAKSEMNTSALVMEVLSDKIRALCDAAIKKAQSEGRKTVLERDF